MSEPREVWVVDQDGSLRGIGRTEAEAWADTVPGSQVKAWTCTRMVPASALEAVQAERDRLRAAIEAMPCGCAALREIFTDQICECHRCAALAPKAHP